MSFQGILLGFLIIVAYILGIAKGAKEEKHFTDMATKRLNDCHAVILGERHE